MSPCISKIMVSVLMAGALLAAFWSVGLAQEMPI